MVILAGIVTNILTGYVLIVTNKNTSEAVVILSLFSTAALSIALCSTFLLQHWLTIEPQGTNPLKNIFTVLRFAARHKTPVRRSAFTYWEAGIPSRIDLAKSKYGGPFTNEEVEDVKACLRILLVIASISVTLLAFSPCAVSMHDALYTTLVYTPSDHSWLDTIFTAALQIFLCITLSHPVCEVTVQTLIRRLNCGTMKRIGVVKVAMVCVSLALLALMTIWYMKNTSSECMFATTNPSPLPINHKWVALPLQALSCFCVFFFTTALVEFVCAQAPYNMQGLLVGLVYSVLLLTVSLGILNYAIWKINYRYSGTNTSRCGVWFYLFTTITAILGCVLWCAVAKWYKRRERDEPEMCHIFAENYYDH